MKILIVDDESGIRDVCGRVLRAEGHEVADCDSGEAALARLQEHWDLILTDLAMPGRIDGNELVRRARAEGGIPIAMMTSHPSVPSTVAALHDGACDYLLKPFPLSALLDLVRRRQSGQAQAPAPIEPRRLRMATILFVDVRGFSFFSESLPADEAASRLDEVLTCFIEAVHAEGGAVNKLLGDGAMAVFGAPLPHPEPDAAAARAALRARTAIKRLSALRCGFGINTGLVAAGCLGSDGSAEYGIIGAPVNVAARLVEAAGPGEILVGGETAVFLDGRFALKRECALTLKGFRTPVRASELISYTAS